MVRCSGCGHTAWRVGGVEVPKDRALAVLSAAFTSGPPRPPRAPRVTRPAATHSAASPAADPYPAAPQPAPMTARPHPELAELLAGWQVLGRSG
jgi:hypothetical protein